jgi:hypothetical protein
LTSVCALAVVFECGILVNSIGLLLSLEGMISATLALPGSAIGFSVKGNI